MNKPPVDVCLILEGTYPYVFGGVASWTHELIKRQSHLNFHIVSILPPDDKSPIRYELPKNVVGLTTLYLQNLPEGRPIPNEKASALFNKLKQPLININTARANLDDLKRMMEAVRPYRGSIGSKVMIDSEPAWELIGSMYEMSYSDSSMLDYFWSWRVMVSALYSLMIVDLPDAKCYHSLSTGYAGILAARAKLETGRPLILTEHGIYTNERRIEITLADWLDEAVSRALTIDQMRLNLRDMWIEMFTNYSRICYEAADHIVTLFAGNQSAQSADGAPPEKMKVIPNGINLERYGNIVKKPHPRPTVALIARLVPIKDVKNFLRAIAVLSHTIPDLRALIIGSDDEDGMYAQECREMVKYSTLEDTVVFVGHANITDYLPEIDVLVSSSISEAQPLVILEAGACGIPAVVTDVGACREMVIGRPDEQPALGAGGVVTQLSSPQALAEAVLKLFNDQQFYKSCSDAMRHRVARYYNEQDQQRAYRELYASCIGKNK